MDVLGTVRRWLGGGATGIDAGGLARATPEKKAKIAKFFLSRVKSGERWLKDEWAESREAYEGETKKEARHRANLYRTKIDTSAAFLDRELLNIVMTPQDGYESDKFALGLAECEEDVYRYIFREQHFDTEIRAMRHSADLTNIGAVWHVVDKRKHLPTIRRLDIETQLAVDADCGGDLRQAAWIAVAESISPAILSRMPMIREAGITQEQLRKAADLQSSVQNLEGDDEESGQRAEAAETVSKTDRKCKVWHVYCRNHIALYDSEYESKPEGEPKAHLERFRDKHGMNEPRRYVVVVEGLKETPVVDIDRWPKPVNYDFDEWPVTVLMYNRMRDKVAGFTDYRHESRLLADHETSLRDLHTRDTMRNPPKFAKARGCPLSDDVITRLLASKKVEVFEDTITEDGKPLLALLDWGTLSEWDVRRPEQLRELYEYVSMVPELLRGEQMEEKRTATEVQSVIEGATAKLMRRLKAYENAQSEIARKTMQTAHIILPRSSRVEVLEPVMAEMPDPMTGVIREVPTGEMQYVIYGEPPMPPLPWAAARERLREPGADLIYMGVDAMVGEEKAQHWDDDMPLDLIRRSVKVAIERSSATRRENLEKVDVFAEKVWAVMLWPLVQQMMQVDPTQAMKITASAVEKVVRMLDLDQYEDLIPDPEQLGKMFQQAQQAQQAQAQAEAAQQAQPAGVA